MSEVLGTGRFRLDRRAALEKLGEYRFEDPRRYALELLAAAVAAGAARVDWRNDADDLVVSWPGTVLAPDELETVFDPLFGQPNNAREAMRQHLAIGVLGALSLKPKWIHIDSGDGESARRLIVKDALTTTLQTLSPPIDGVRIHVRERLSPGVMLEALQIAVRAPKETELLRGTLHRYPLPFVVNGVVFPVAVEPEPWVLRWSGNVGKRRAELWLVPMDAGIDVVRNGIVVGKVQHRIGRMNVAGWVQSDDVRLNASRAKVVQDGNLESVLRSLETAAFRLADEGLAALDPQDHLETLHWKQGGHSFSATRAQCVAHVAGALLDERDAGEHGPWAAIPCLADLRGAEWSVATLRGLVEPPCVSRVAIDVPGWTAPTFPTALQARLEKVGFQPRDVTGELQAHALGLARRAKLAGDRQPAALAGAEAQQRFEQLPYRGSVRVLDPGGDRLDVRLQIDGLVVETVALPTPGCRLEAVLDHPDFATDTAFQHVVKDAVFSGGVDLLRVQATAHLRAHVENAVAGRDWTRALQMGINAFFATRSRPLPGGLDGEPWLKMRFVPLGDGTLLSPADLESPPTSVGRWLVVTEVPLGLLPEDLGDALVVPATLVRTFRDWLGPRAIDGRLTLAARMARRQRLSRPKVEPVLSGPTLCRCVVDDPPLRGELGLLAPGAQGGVLFVKGGVPIETRALDGVPRQVTGVIEAPDAQVSETWDALTDSAVAHLVPRVRRHARRMLVEWAQSLQKDRPLPDVLLEWLQSALEASLARELGACVVATRVDGTQVTLADIGRKGKKEPKWTLVASPPDVPGFEDALLESPPLRALLERASPGRWREGTPLVDKILAARRALETSPPYWEPPSLRRSKLTRPDWSGSAVLPVVPEKAGVCEVVVLWRGRVLERSVFEDKVGALVVAEGERLAPDRLYQRVADRRAFEGLAEVAQEGLWSLVREATADFRTQDAPLWRNLLRLALAAEPDVLPALLRLPLLPCVDGRVATADELRSWVAAKVRLLRVPPTSKPWTSREAVYVLEEPGVTDLLKALYPSGVPDGTGDLEAARTAAARRALLRPMEARVSGLEFTGPFVTEGASGEVGLDVRASALFVTVLADGLPLCDRVLPSPIPARAIVQGPALRANRAFDDLIDDPASKRVFEELQHRVRALARRHLEPPGTGAVVDAWHSVRLAFALVDEKASAWPLLLQGGNRARPLSVAALRALAGKHGAVGYVRSDASVRTEPPAPCLSPSEVSALEKAVPLRDLLKLVSRATPPGRLGGVAPIRPTPPFSGMLGLTLGDDGVQVLVDGIVGKTLSALECGSPVPLGGQITAPDLALAISGMGVVELKAGASAALAAVVAEAGKTLAAQLVKAVDTVGGPAVHLIRHSLKELGKLDPDHVLCQAALLQTCLGVKVNLASVLRSGEVRYVTTHHPCEELLLDETDVAWLKDHVKLVDVTARVGEIEAGRARRRAARTAPIPPSSASTREVSGYPRSYVWLSGPGTWAPPSIAIVAEGRVVEQRPLGVTGASGFLSGSFEVDDAFTKAKVPERAWSAVLDTVRRLLDDELASPTEEQRRLAMDRLPALGGAQLSAPWPDVVALRTAAGAPLSLGELARSSEKAHELLWTPTRGQGVPDEALVIPPSLVDRWARKLAPATLIHVDDRRRVEAERASVRALAKEEKERSQRLKDLLTVLSEILPQGLPTEGLAEASGAAHLENADPRDLVTLHLLAARVLDAKGRAVDELTVVRRLVERWPR